MTLYKFENKDKIFNVVKSNPKVKFWIHDTELDKIYDFHNLNIQGYSFIPKDYNLTSFRSVSTNDFAQADYGTQLTGSLIENYDANISRFYFAGNSERWITGSFVNLCKEYTLKSKHFEYENTEWSKAQQEMTVISVPSIFYGSRINPGSVNLEFKISGTVAGCLKDINKNGELIETVGPNEGTVAGLCFYNEGFMALTGTYEISGSYGWTDWGLGLDDFLFVGLIDELYFGLEFEGEFNTPMKTMLCRAPKGHLNHSNNPTFPKYGQINTPSISSNSYVENPNIEIKNAVLNEYETPEELPFEKTTYISEIYLYDDKRNVIGVAKLANPVKKTEERDYIFKLKLDL